MNEIEEKTKRIWNSKINFTMKQRNLLSHNPENKFKKSFYIINNILDEFEDNKIYITTFLQLLWEYPELVYEIIKNSEPDELRNNIAPFIINNFYSDYLSGNFIENNLLYIIALLLKNEFEKIDSNEKIENIEKQFENSNLGIVLDSFGQIPIVQNFFKNLITKSVEMLERKNTMDNVYIDSDELSSKLEEIKEGNKNVNIKKKYLNLFKKKENDDTINQNAKNKKVKSENFKIFVEQYIININLSIIIERKNLAKKEKKDDLFLLLSYIEQEMKSSNDEDLFSNKILLDNFYKSKSSYFMLSFYENEFIKGADFISQIITDFENNIALMPKFIKSICKIISELIKKKFKNFTKKEENILISKFLIEKLLIYYLTSPNFISLINDFIISESTIKNIQEITFALKKIFLGKLFKNNLNECNYTPYNWLILNKFQNIVNIFENSKKVKLPNFISNLINDKLPPSYNYDYFKENKELIFTNISICFTLDNFFALIDGTKKVGNFFEINKNEKKNRIKITLDKLDNKERMAQMKKINEKIIKNYIKEVKEKNIKIDSKYVENYFILNIQIIDNKYEKYFSFDADKNKYFFIEIKNEKEEQLNEEKINLINLKNNLSKILGIYRPFDISDYSLNTSSTFKEIFLEIKKYMNLSNYTFEKIDNIKTYYWSITSIFDFSDKIPDEYKLDDFGKLFYEMSQEITASIKEINLGLINSIKSKVIFINKSLNYYEENGKVINDIIINENIKKLIKEIPILIDFKFIYDDEEKIFILNKSMIKTNNFEGDIIYNKKSDLYTIKTIETLIKFFPNLTDYFSIMCLSPLDIIKEISINKKLKEYFDLIKITLTNKSSMEKDNYDELYQEKIINYVMDKIYEKIYPSVPNPQDLNILNIIRRIPKSYLENLVNKNYNYENLIPDVTLLFQKINNSRTPLGKLNCLKEILDYITNAIAFKTGKKVNSLGADDTIPALIYFLINAKPYMIITDIEFIKTFKCILPFCDNELSIFEIIVNKLLTSNFIEM